MSKDYASVFDEMLLEGRKAMSEMTARGESDAEPSDAAGTADWAKASGARSISGNSAGIAFRRNLSRRNLWSESDVSASTLPYAQGWASCQSYVRTPTARMTANLGIAASSVREPHEVFVAPSGGGVEDREFPCQSEALWRPITPTARGLGVRVPFQSERSAIGWF